MSPLELVDDRFEKLAEQLRASRPVASPALRERIRALEAPPQRRRRELSFSVRRLVPAVGLAALGVAVGTAVVIGIVHGSTRPRAINAGSAFKALASKPPVKRTIGSAVRKTPNQPFDATLSQGLKPAAGRLQQYDASLRVRVRNQEELSKRTQDAVRLTRKLGGYLAWANYSTPRNRGASELLLQIPIDRVQAAIAAFTGYGTLVSQRIRLKDLQQRVDTLATRIERLRAEIARLEQSGADPGRLQRDRALLARLLRARSSTVERAQMASVALAIVVGPKAAAAPPGRFHRTIDDAGSVLLRELEILVYALVVAGPLLAIGGAGILAGRSVRRRSNDRLLERS